MNKLFIWGESGFIGSILKKHFHKQSLSINLIGRGIKCHHTIDLANDTSIPKSIDQNSIVFFLSAISSPDICNDNSSIAKKINLTNTSIVISKILDIGATVIFFSTDLIYGNSNKIFIETSSPDPKTNYSLWKCMVEKRFSNYNNFKTIRLSYLCDINDKFTSFLINSKKDNIVEIYDPFYRSMIHSDDFLKIIDLYIKDKSLMPNILNVCGQQCISRLQYVKSFSNYINLKWKSVNMPEEFKINRPERIELNSLYIRSLISYSWSNPGDGIIQQIKND